MARNSRAFNAEFENWWSASLVGGSGVGPKALRNAGARLTLLARSYGNYDHGIRRRVALWQVTLPSGATGRAYSFAGHAICAVYSSS